MDATVDWRFETEAAAEAEFLRSEALDRRCRLIHATRRAYQAYERAQARKINAIADGEARWYCQYLALKVQHRIARYNTLVCVLARAAGVSPNLAAGLVANGGAGMYAGALTRNV